MNYTNKLGSERICLCSTNMQWHKTIWNSFIIFSFYKRLKFSFPLCLVPWLDVTTKTQYIAVSKRKKHCGTTNYRKEKKNSRRVRQRGVSTYNIEMKWRYWAKFTLWTNGDVSEMGHLWWWLQIKKTKNHWKIREKFCLKYSRKE